jgi:hypothetical protein
VVDPTIASQFTFADRQGRRAAHTTKCAVTNSQPLEPVSLGGVRRRAPTIILLDKHRSRHDTEERSKRAKVCLSPFTIPEMESDMGDAQKRLVAKHGGGRLHGEQVI